MKDSIKIAIIFVAVVLAAVLFFNKSPTPIVPPDVENLGDATCNLPASFCTESILTFYKCKNNAVNESKYNCASLSDNVSNWTCNPRQVIVKDGVEITRANCEPMQSNSQEPVENQSNDDESSLSSSGSGSNSQASGSTGGIQRAPPLAYCGNNVTDVGETCVSCPGDFKCTAAEYCPPESGLCRKINSFGDGNCTATENRTGVDCSSCGCPNERICNIVTKQCIASVSVTPSFMSKVDDLVGRTVSNDTVFLGLSDTIYNGKGAKMAVFDCDPQNTFYCRTYIIVDQNGNVLGTVHTT